MEKAYKVHVIQLLTEVFNMMVYKAKEKSSLVSVNQPGEIFFITYRPHSWMCIRIYVFNFKKQTNKKKKQEYKKAKETKEVH